MSTLQQGSRAAYLFDQACNSLDIRLVSELHCQLMGEVPHCTSNTVRSVATEGGVLVPGSSEELLALFEVLPFVPLMQLLHRPLSDIATLPSA